MFKPKKQIEYYNQRAPEYEQIYFRDNPQRRKEIDDEAERLQEIISGKTVLDIACGTGYWTKVISEKAKLIIACDISMPMIEQARQKEYTCPAFFIQANLNNLPFADKSFDFISFGFWFSHHPRQLYKELFEIITRLLTDDGTIWMIDNNPPAEGPTQESTGSDEYGNNYKKRYLDDGREYTILKNYFTKEQLNEILSADFNLKKLIFNKYYWSVQLKK